MKTQTTYPRINKIDTTQFIKVMSFMECCTWLSRAIYDIETRQLCSRKDS